MNLSSTETATTQSRKADHIRICLEADVQCHQATNGLERYRFTHHCLPELDYQDIDLSTNFLDKKLGAPLLISSMTGGTPQAGMINQRLAKVAQKYHLAMGVGSQRVAVEKPEVADTFAVRKYAPDILLFANLGAVQLNYDYGLEQCLRAIDILNGTVFRGAKNLILFTDEGDETSIGAILKEEVQTARIARRVVALDGTLFTDKDDQEMEELAQSAENYRLAGDQTGLANAFTDLAEQMRQTDRFVFERPGDFVDRPRLIRFTFNLR